MIDGSYCFVLHVDGTTIFTTRFDFNPSTINGTSIFRVLKWTAPLINNEVNIDLSDSLSNRVEDNRQIVYDGIQGPASRYEFRVISGEVFKETKWDFTRLQNGRLLAFNDKVALRGPQEPPFSVGDLVNIEMDPFVWSYNDNFFVANKVGYTGTLRHWARGGEQIIVTGQITNPQYNGPTRIDSVIANNQIKTTTNWAGSTPAEGGQIAYALRPEWNIRAKIISVFLDSPNWYLVFDIDIPVDDPFWGSSSNWTNIKGSVIDPKPLVIPNVEQSSLKRAYSSHQTNMNIDMDGFSSIVKENGQPRKAPISRNGRNMMVVHLQPFLSWNWNSQYIFRFYDGSDTLVQTYTMNTQNNGNDYYIPVAIEDLPVSVPMTAKYYTINAVQNGSELSTPEAIFELTDCSSYKEWNLIWRDERGSYLSYPFDLISSEATSTERNKWYAEDGEEDYFVKSFNFYSLSSNWIEEEYNYMFKDMLKSPQHFLKKPDGEIIKVSLQTSDIEWGSREKDGVFQYNVALKESKKETRM
jgi:hypothetical protein